MYTDRAWQIKSLSMLRKYCLEDILLVPRIHPSVINSIDNKKYIKLRNKPLKLTKERQAIYGSLVKLMIIAIRKIKFFGKILNIDFSFLKPSSTFTDSITILIELHIGRSKCAALPKRIKALMRDVEKLARLIRAATECDDIEFSGIVHSILNDSKEYSMFIHPDKETSELVYKITSTSLNEIYTLVRGELKDEEEEQKKYILVNRDAKMVRNERLLHGYTVKFKHKFKLKLGCLLSILDNINSEKQQQPDHSGKDPQCELNEVILPGNIINTPVQEKDIDTSNKYSVRDVKDDNKEILNGGVKEFSIAMNSENVYVINDEDTSTVNTEINADR